jgi:hypothetical protein
MKPLWTRIGLGAIGVFLLGMMGISLGREVKGAATDFVRGRLGGSASAPAALASLDRLGSLDPHAFFRFEGAVVGDITRLEAQRVRANEMVGLDLVVDLTDRTVEGRLAGCLIAPMAGHHGSGGFRCASADESGLFEAGTIRFEPSGLERPLLLPARDAASFHHGEPFRATADLSGDVNVNVDGQEGTLRLQADSKGAQLNVTDADGTALVRLVADEGGAFLRVRDRSGREVLRLEAGGAGVNLEASPAH